MSKELQIAPEIDLAAFISKEAHDLKSPFNRALGFLKLVLDGFDGPISEQAREDLTVAHQNTQYSLVMLNALVDAARLERGENGPILETLLLNIVLQESISKWTRIYHKKNTVDISFSAPDLKILADDIMIRQCLRHWISYVNEFVQGTASIHIQVDEQPKDCLFTIRSTGTKQPKPPECDLTLYGFVAKGILDMHKGQLIQLNEYNQGAVVQFSLPIL